jgi:hypothetical protein
MRRQLGALALAALLAGAACGSDVGAESTDAAGGAEPTSTTTDGPDRAGRDVRDPDDGGDGSGGAAGDGSATGVGATAVGSGGSTTSAPTPDRRVTTTTRPGGAAGDDSEPDEPTGIVKSVDPTCVVAPGSVRIRIETVPLADVAYGLAFADGEHHGQYGLGRADNQGVLLWTVAVPTGVSPGIATATVAGAGETGGGQGNGWFEVAGAGGCA